MRRKKKKQTMSVRNLELLFFTVLALPNASSTGLDYARSTCRNEEVSAGAVIKEERGGGGNGEFFFFSTSRTCCSTVRPSVPDRPPMNARYLMSILVVSVLPAPLSPLTRIAWLAWSLMSALEFSHCRLGLTTLYLQRQRVERLWT